MIKKSIASSIIMAVFFIIGVCGQNSKSSLLDQKVTVKLENAPFWQFTNFLTRTLKVPIGFEESDHDTTHSDYDFDPNTPSIFGEPKNRGRVTFIGVDIKVNAVGHFVSLDVQAVRLSDVLDLVVAQMPNYEWSEVRGVIRFMPKRGRSTVFKELLNVRIETVTIETGVLIKVIRMELPFLTEIAEFYERNKLVRKQFFVVGNSHKPLRQTIEMKNCTFEELLNEIVRVKGGGWLLRYSKQDTASEGARVIDLVL